MILTMASLRNDGVPEELANRMSVAHGSRELLRSLRGEPAVEQAPASMQQPRLRNGPRKRGYIPMAERPKFGAPEVVRAIFGTVEYAFDLLPGAIRGRGRSQAEVLARSVAIKLVRDRTWTNGEPRHSLPTIGRYVNRDHSTVCHSLRMFDEYCRQFPEAAELYEQLREAEE